MRRETLLCAKKGFPDPSQETLGMSSRIELVGAGVPAGRGLMTGTESLSQESGPAVIHGAISTARGSRVVVTSGPPAVQPPSALRDTI
jgi:hypothetical protein